MAKITPVLQTLDELKAYMSNCSVKNSKVTNWSVGMQIEHCLIGTKGICGAVVQSEPYTGKVKKSLVRRVIFLTGTIPRGRGKAPERSVPKSEPTESRLQELLIETQLIVQTAAEAGDDCWWEHFMFGVMKRDDALRFVEIHNKHHLKIISDILETS